MKLQRQRAVSMLLILFFVLLAGLTLFSNTFQTAMLPKVATEMPQKKSLSHSVKGSGIITAIEKKEISSENGGKVAVIHVKEEEAVKKGQPLISFDDADLEPLRQQLREAEIQIEKQRLTRELLKEQFVAAQHDGDEIAISKAKRDLQLDQLDKELAELKIGNMRKQLERSQSVTAPFDGIIIELNIAEGASVSAGQTVMKLVNPKAGFEMSFGLDGAAAELMELGSRLPVSIRTKEGKRLQAEGTIEEIKSAESGSENASETALRKTIVVHFFAEGMHEGNQAEIAQMIPAREQGLVLRKELLKKDGKGSYVFVVREVKSSLGNKYLAEKVYVAAGEEIGDEVIILRGLAPNDNVISESSEPLQEHNRVRLM